MVAFYVLFTEIHRSLEVTPCPLGVRTLTGPDIPPSPNKHLDIVSIEKV